MSDIKSQLVALFPEWHSMVSSTYLGAFARGRFDGDQFLVIFSNKESIPYSVGYGHRMYSLGKMPSENRPEQGWASLRRLEETDLRHLPRGLSPNPSLVGIPNPCPWDILYSLKMDSYYVDYSIDDIVKEFRIDAPSKAIEVHAAIHKAAKLYNMLVPARIRDELETLLQEY